MNNLATFENRILPMSADSIEAVRRAENMSLALLPQVELETDHILHGGMYARTICVPAGGVLTGALIKRATILIVNGEAEVYAGDKSVRVDGYLVLAASAQRKQAFVAIRDTILTMIFPTNAQNTHDAEDEFTDEADMLMSRLPDAKNHITITGE